MNKPKPKPKPQLVKKSAPKRERRVPVTEPQEQQQPEQEQPQQQPEQEQPQQQPQGELEMLEPNEVGVEPRAKPSQVATMKPNDVVNIPPTMGNLPKS